MTFKENLAYLKYFGFRLTFYKSINTLLKKTKGKIAWKIHDWNNNMIEAFLKQTCPKSYKQLCEGYYDEIVEQASDEFVNQDVPHNSVIWTVWWQGEENAPQIVKACINNMRKHSNGHPVIVLDKDNIGEYVKLPLIIEKRFLEATNDTTQLRKCTLDITQKSDIIRMYLLFHYGGVWVDATMMFTDDIDEYFFIDKWNTLGQDDEWYIGRGKWSSFFMAATVGNGLIKFNYDMHVEYWTNKKYFVHYLMTDHMFDIAYKERKKITLMIDEGKSENRKCLTINRLYETPVNNEEATEFFENQKFHKLSWRWWGNTKECECKLSTSTGELTWLGYIFEHYIREK